MMDEISKEERKKFELDKLNFELAQKSSVKSLNTDEFRLPE